MPLALSRRPALIALIAVPIVLSACVAAATPRGAALPGAMPRPAAYRSPDPPRGVLLERTLQVLDDQIPDLPFDASTRLDYIQRARRTFSFEEERELVQAMLRKIPASHIALFSSYAKEYFEGELGGQDAPTIGFFLAEIDGDLIITKVLRGTPAAAAGLRRGDRLLRIDGVRADRSRRLDPRHDDSAPPDEASHVIRVREGDRVTVRIGRGGGGPETTLDVVLPVAVTSSLRSDRAGVQIVEHDEVSVGVLPLSYLYSRDTSRHVLDALAGPLSGADAIVLDLRGRGGSAIALHVLTRMLQRESVLGKLPLVAAIDRRSRSAKEVLARDIRRLKLGTLVGEATPGAVRPARFIELPGESWLLCPHGLLSENPRGLEGIGVAPDLEVKDSFPEGDGSDPILAAAITEAARQARGGDRPTGSER